MKKYFVELKDKVGTCYFEFGKGNWDKRTFWKENSIYIHGEDLCHCDFLDIVIDVIPNCNPFGETEISKGQWEQIYEKAVLCGGRSAEIAQAAEPWVADTLQEHHAFYILGV